MPHSLFFIDNELLSAAERDVWRARRLRLELLGWPGLGSKLVGLLDQCGL